MRISGDREGGRADQIERATDRLRIEATRRRVVAGVDRAIAQVRRDLLASTRRPR